MRFKGLWPNEIMKEKVVGGETRSPFWLAQIYVLYPTTFNLWNGSAFSWRSLGEHGEHRNDPICGSAIALF
ncbi:hypothetical protein BBD40_11100 [Paenibacillus ihbetae]|uniref:Uncharacterized protein n=1 Tax=Paenibacillus ihbetae TaxID=1870820 RepID=A0ABX3JXG8_9BACL|nr:hypothetical protein BBD40_11100 [Paenibacillus ihbetae]